MRRGELRERKRGRQRGQKSRGVQEERAVMGRQIQGVFNEKAGMELVQGEVAGGAGGGWRMTVMNVR